MPLPASKDELKDRPEAENLLNIYAALADQDRDAVIAQFAGQQFSGFKNALAELTVAKLEPIAAEMRRLLADPAEIDRILKAGATAPAPSPPRSWMRSRSGSASSSACLAPYLAA